MVSGGHGIGWMLPGMQTARATRMLIQNALMLGGIVTT